jgi:hypothetical protein
MIGARSQRALPPGVARRWLEALGDPRAWPEAWPLEIARVDGRGAEIFVQGAIPGPRPLAIEGVLRRDQGLSFTGTGGDLPGFVVRLYEEAEGVLVVELRLFTPFPVPPPLVRELVEVTVPGWLQALTGEGPAGHGALGGPQAQGTGDE